MPSLQSIRSAHQLIRLVLVWFVLSVGVSMASPLVHPQATQLVCGGAGVLKLQPSGDDDASSSVARTLDCPQCLISHGAPPLEGMGWQPPSPEPLLVPVQATPAVALAPTVQPPPRGPPALL